MGLPVHHRGHLRHRPASHAHGGWRPCVRARGGRASVLFRGQGWRNRVAKGFQESVQSENPRVGYGGASVGGWRPVDLCGGRRGHHVRGVRQTHRQGTVARAHEPATGVLSAGHPHLRRSTAVDHLAQRRGGGAEPANRQGVLDRAVATNLRHVHRPASSGGQPVVRHEFQPRLRLHRGGGGRPIRPNRLARQHTAGRGRRA